MAAGYLCPSLLTDADDPKPAHEGLQHVAADIALSSRTADRVIAGHEENGCESDNVYKSDEDEFFGGDGGDDLDKMTYL